MANTRREIENGDVEGASWGVHDGQLYGYKANFVIDAAIELLVATLLTTGKRNDQCMFVPLIDGYPVRSLGFETKEPDLRRSQC